MRATIILIILLVKSFNISAQVDVFPDTNASWHIIEYMAGLPQYIDTVYDIVSKRDTIINNKVYEVIGFLGNKVRDYAIREDSMRVWVIYLNRLMDYCNSSDSIYWPNYYSWNHMRGNDSTEYLLYDYNLQIDDTVSIYFPPFTQSSITGNVITDTGGFYKFTMNDVQPDICVNQIMRKQIQLHCIELIPNSSSYYDIFFGPWIEGVGSLCGGPVYTETFCGFESVKEINNIIENGHQIYPCTMNVEENELFSQKEIYYNNLTNEIIINIDQDIKSIKVYNQLGKVVYYKNKMSSNKASVSLKKNILSICYVIVQNVNNKYYTEKILITK